MCLRFPLPLQRGSYCSGDNLSEPENQQQMELGLLCVRGQTIPLDTVYRIENRSSFSVYPPPQPTNCCISTKDHNVISASSSFDFDLQTVSKEVYFTVLQLAVQVYDECKLCLYCVKYWMIAGQRQWQSLPVSGACYVCLMIELTFAHANTVWSLSDKFYNEPSSGKHRMECYEC